MVRGDAIIIRAWKNHTRPVHEVPVTDRGPWSNIVDYVSTCEVLLMLEGPVACVFSNNRFEWIRVVTPRGVIGWMTAPGVDVLDEK